MANNNQSISKDMGEIMFSLPLEAKILKTQQRIREYVDEFGLENVYISFSGGKDSTVLLHLARQIYPEIKAMFVNTGLEYPEIVQFVKTIDNVDIIRPKITFVQVLDKYGYPVISKEQSQYIYQYRTAKSEKTRQTRWFGNRWGMGKISEKWKFLVESPFDISDKCCDVMKKNPAKKYEKDNEMHPIIGTMATESNHRKTLWYKNGCNSFEAKRPTSKPISFWTEKDIWDYINQFNVDYSTIYDMGYERTGCMFCMYGCHREDSPNRFQKMKLTHPKIYKYCIENLKIGEILDFIGVEYE